MAHRNPKNKPRRVKLRRVGDEYTICLRNNPLHSMCMDWETVTGFSIPTGHEVQVKIEITVLSQVKQIPEPKSEPQPQPTRNVMRERERIQQQMERYSRAALASPPRFIEQQLTAGPGIEGPSRNEVRRAREQERSLRDQYNRAMQRREIHPSMSFQEYQNRMSRVEVRQETNGEADERRQRMMEGIPGDFIEHAWRHATRSGWVPPDMSADEFIDRYAAEIRSEYDREESRRLVNRERILREHQVFLSDPRAIFRGDMT